jgi:hypothetical protein
MRWVAEILATRAVGKFPTDGLDYILTAAKAYLHSNPKRDGAAALKAAIQWAGMAKRCIEQGKAKDAAWCTGQAVHAVWHAEIADARHLIDGGVSSYRKSEQENERRHRLAEREREAWRMAAARLRATPRHANKSKSDIARLIDPERWSTIRKHI